MEIITGYCAVCGSKKYANLTHHCSTTPTYATCDPQPKRNELPVQFELQGVVQAVSEGGMYAHPTTLSPGTKVYLATDPAMRETIGDAATMQGFLKTFGCTPSMKASEVEYQMKLKNEAEQQMMTIEKMYYELLHAVGNKYSNETRHETALRYIRQADERASVAAETIMAMKART